MFKILVTSVNLVLCSLLLFACSPGATPPTPTQVSAASQVLIQGNTLAEETQTIELDNCDGKAEIVRSEQRGQSVDVTVSAEVAAKLGVSAQVIQAEVQATVGAQVTDSGYRSSTIQLVAPPKTRMVFQIVWSGPEQVGIVQNLKSVGVPIAFRRFSPTDVKIKSQIDVGCSTVTPGKQQPISTIPVRATPVVIVVTATPPSALGEESTPAVQIQNSQPPSPVHLRVGDDVKLSEGWVWVCTGDFAATNQSGIRTEYFDHVASTGLVLVLGPNSQVSLSGPTDMSPGHDIGDCAAFSSQGKATAINQGTFAQLAGGCGSKCLSVRVVELGTGGQIISDYWKP